MSNLFLYVRISNYYIYFIGFSNGGLFICSVLASHELFFLQIFKW